jgi:hypothetical protein
MHAARDRTALVLIAFITTGCALGAEERADTPELASGRPVPHRCAPATPGGAATVTFVANGSAWALDPGSGTLTCLFATPQPGPFAWGPRGDRALLARLEVKGLRDAPSRPAGRAAPSASSWGRPTGKSIVFVGRGGRRLLKVHPAGGGVIDVTPIDGPTYERVVYHPSGLAFAFILDDHGRESLWLSSNTGEKPRQLVHGRFHTDFETVAFSRDGGTLYFAAMHAGGRVDVHSASLSGGNEAPVVWRGGPAEHVTNLIPGIRTNIAFTAGRSCATSHAYVVTPRHSTGVEAFPDEPRSQAVGWMDDAHLLVAAGGCGRPLDLHAVAVRTLTARLLVKGVDAAAARRAEPYPPPALPRRALDAASGFA